MGNAQTKVILALDSDRLEDAKRMVELTRNRVDMYKVGSILFTGYGVRIIDAVKESGKGLFLDLKFHDIPNTVRGAVRAAALHGVAMLTVHTSGGVAMMQAALAGAADGAAAAGGAKPLIMGVTVLTSLADQDDMAGRVLDLAGKAADAGVDGVVCSTGEVGKIKQAYGQRLMAVVPGIRLGDQASDDQARVGTPAQASAGGADFIVVGRSVTQSANPDEMLARIAEEVANA